VLVGDVLVPSPLFSLVEAFKLLSLEQHITSVIETIPTNKIPLSVPVLETIILDGVAFVQMLVLEMKINIW